MRQTDHPEDDYFENLDKEPQEIIPEVGWKIDLERIENPDIQEEEIERAREIVKQGKELEAQLSAGEITKDDYHSIREHDLEPQIKEARMRAGHRSGRIQRRHLGDPDENWQDLDSAQGNMDAQKRLGEAIDDVGHEVAEELADRMLEDKKIGEQTHERMVSEIDKYKK